MFIASAQAGPEAILSYTDSISAFISSTVGWTFQSTKVVTVTELGCFAKVFDDSPAVGAIQVGLWDDSGGLLASTTITRDSGLFDVSRYESVAPVTLASGQVYHLGAYYAGGRIGMDVAGSVAGGSVTTASEIQLRSAASGTNGFVFPEEVSGTSGALYAGPNFRFESRPILAIARLGANQIRLSWPSAYPGFSLQSELGLTGTWAGAGLSVNLVGSEYVAVDTVGNGPKFYRLAK